MDIFFKNDGSYSQSTVGILVLVDYTPIGFVREVNADMVTCFLFDKLIRKEWLAQRLTTKEPDIYKANTLVSTTWSLMQNKKVKARQLNSYTNG